MNYLKVLGISALASTAIVSTAALVGQMGQKEELRQENIELLDENTKLKAKLDSLNNDVFQLQTENAENLNK